MKVPFNKILVISAAKDDYELKQHSLVFGTLYVRTYGVLSDHRYVKIHTHMNIYVSYNSFYYYFVYYMLCSGVIYVIILHTTYYVQLYTDTLFLTEYSTLIITKIL